MTRITIALVAAGALALAASPAAATGHHGKLTIKATSKLDQVRVIDNSPVGDSPGDLLVFTEKLYNARGRQIGSDSATCVRLFDPSSLCTGVYRLAGGRLMVQLEQPSLSGTVAYDQAITGGTGRYDGARGTVRVAQSASGDRFTFKIRLD